jgi:hypothetical protein
MFSQYAANNTPWPYPDVVNGTAYPWQQWAGKAVQRQSAAM